MVLHRDGNLRHVVGYRGYGDGNRTLRPSGKAMGCRYHDGLLPSSCAHGPRHHLGAHLDGYCHSLDAGAAGPQATYVEGKEDPHHFDLYGWRIVSIFLLFLFLLFLSSSQETNSDLQGLRY